MPRLLILFRMVQYTFEKCAETAIGCCSNILDSKKDILYNLLAMIGQWYSKDVNDGLILSNQNKRNESLRTVEELTLEYVRSTSKFPDKSRKCYQQLGGACWTTYFF